MSKRNMDYSHTLHDDTTGFSLDPRPIDLGRFRVVPTINPCDLRFAFDDDTAAFLVRSMSALRSAEDDFDSDGSSDWSNLMSNASKAADESCLPAVSPPSPTMTQKLAGRQVSRLASRNSPETKAKAFESTFPPKGGHGKLHSHHKDLWEKRFQELLNYKRQHGNCCVPHNFTPNLPLAKWVKRQRYQYNLKMAGDHSTLFDDRQSALEEIGFVWDYHSVVWQEKMNELIEFKAKHGHIDVPSAHGANLQLAIWIQCQRRQYKLYFTEEKSYMTEERIRKLDAIGFVWIRRGAS